MPHLFTVTTASGAGKLYLYRIRQGKGAWEFGKWKLETVPEMGLRGKSQETYLWGEGATTSGI
jgi:hypothetical protein